MGSILQTVIEYRMKIQSNLTRNSMFLNGLFLCNNIAYNDVQRNLSTFLMVNDVSDNSYMWSKFEGQNIKVGATYSAYQYAGEN